MERLDDLLRLITGAHALTRVAALETRSEAPAAQWRTIALLREHGPQRIGDLAALSRVTQPGMTRLTAQMAQSGLLVRTPDPLDSRATVVSATPEGLAALDGWLQLLGSVLAPRFSDLGNEDWDAIGRVAAILNDRTPTKEHAR